jgi:Lrp/AsnC family leucine-responsive transcriptional regulator
MGRLRQTMTNPDLSAVDVRILRELQRDGRLTNVELASRVGLSPSPCLRRVKQLEAAGIIAGYRAVLDPKSLGLGLDAFVQVNIERHTDEDAEAFRQAVAARPEVVSARAMTGEMDFLLHIRVADLEEYGAFTMGTLLRMPGVKDVRSSFVLQEIKPERDVPIPAPAR